MSKYAHGQFHNQDNDAAFPLVEEGNTRARANTEFLSALSLAQRRFEATFHHAPVGMAHVALDGRFLLVNPRFCEICGYDVDELIRTGFQQITHPDDLTVDEALLARLHAGEIARYTLEKRYIRADGTIVWINLTVAMVRDDADRPEFYVAVIEDLSELRRASYAADHDSLTGLLNRRGLVCCANDMFAAAGREGRAFSLLFLDLDGFKQLNDRRGHAAGDACLVDVAGWLGANARAQDAVARVGGDEFVMLFPDLSARAARALAERVRDGLSLRCAAGDAVSGSFGLVTASGAGAADLDRLIACADGAMLAAKRAGKNRLMVARYSAG